MSDQQGGPGWWLASDGRWYPPADEPTALQSSTPVEPTGPKWWSRRVPLWALILATIVGIAVGAASTGSDPEETVAVRETEETSTTERSTTSTTREPTTTTDAPTTTTTLAPTTTTAPPPPPPAEVEIAVFEGSGQSTTRPFVVPDGWEIQWDATGDIFQLYVYEESGALNGIAANQQGSGSGTAFQPSAGSYYLQMNAIGTWRVRIIDVN